MKLSRCRLSDRDLFVGPKLREGATVQLGVDEAAQRLWLDQWKGAAIALEEQRRLELRTLTAERARTASDALLSVVPPGDLAAHRRTHSGLVEQQALFHRRPLP